MSDVNRVYLIGNLVKDPELKDIGNGNKVTNFTLAINRHWTGPEGEKAEEVSFIDCVSYGKRAETIEKYLFKGRKIFVEGRLKQDKWTDKETKKTQSRIRIIVESFNFMDNKKENCECSASASIPAEAGNDSSSTSNGDFEAI